MRDRTKKQSAQMKKIRRDFDNLPFLNNFDPEKSARERRKLTRKVATTTSSRDSTIYDEHGRLREFGYLNVCDCMNDKCLGCFNPCPHCGSRKCGPLCRVNRKFTFESIEFDGKETVIRNKFNIKG